MSQDPSTLPTSNFYDDIIGSSPAPATKDPNQGIKSSNRFGAQRPGHIHSGTDFGGAIDSDVGAADDGDVIFAGPDGPKMGNAVKIRHADGTVSVYGHLNQVGTSIGAKVSRGDSIGLLGQTGNAKGPHVHFEVRPGGSSAVDPMTTSYRPLIGALASKARQEHQANAYDDIIGGSSISNAAYDDVIGDSKPLVQTTAQSLTPRQQAQQNLAKTYPPPAPTPVGPAGVEPPTTVSPVLERPRTTGVTTPADNGDRMIYNKMTGGFDQYTIDPGQIRPGERPTDTIRRLQMQDMVVDPQGAAERQAVAGQTFDGAAMFAPPGDSRNVLDKGYELPDQYTTRLSPEDEVKFHQWKQQYAPNDSGADYDLRGAFKAGLQPDPKTGHWPDTFKKPNHPTFSNQSQYAVGADAAKAGSWNGDTFVPPSAQPEGPDFSSALNAANAHLAADAEDKNNRAVVNSVLGPGMYDQSAALHPQDRAKLIENAKYEAQIKNTGQLVNTLNTRQDQINRQAQFRRQQARIAMAKAQRVKTTPQPFDGPWGGVYDRLRDTSSTGFGDVRRAEGRDAKAQAVVDRELARQGPGLDPLADRIHASLQSEGLVGSRPQPLPRHLSEQQIAALDKIAPLTNTDKQSLRDGTPLPPSSVAYSLAPAPATIGPLSFGERVKNSIYNAIQDYAPGLASLNTEEGIKLNPISGAVRGASLGWIKIPEYRASSIPANVGDPTKQISQYDADLADKTGEVLGALAPYVGVNKLLTMASEAPKVATFLNAVRETGMVGRAGVRAAQTATTFGSVSALRETVKAIQGQGGSASDVAKTIGQDAVLGGSIGVLAGDNPNLIRHIYSFVVPAVTMAAVTGKSSSPVIITGDPVTDSGIFNALMAVATHQGAVIEPIKEAAQGVGREVAAPISRAPITFEWLRSRVAEPGGLQHIVLRETAPPEGSGEALARYGDQTPTGRALSVYRDPTDPTNHKIGGTEIDGSKTPDYEQRGVKIVDVTPAQYEQALKSVNSINPTEPSQISAPLPATPQIADVASPSSTGSPIARSVEEMTAPESAQASRAAAEQAKAPLAPGTEPVSAPGEAAAPVLRALQRAHQAGDQPSIDALTKLASERGASQADIDSTKPAVTPPTVETPRVPERPETVQSQLEALTEGRGSRSAVIIPEGHNLPAVPAGLEAHVADNGDTFIYDPKKTSPEAIDKAVESGSTNKLIGAVEPEGPKTDTVVIARAPDGTESQAVYVSPEKAPQQVAEFQAQHPDSTIEVGTKATEQRVLDERRVQVEQASQPASEAAQPATSVSLDEGVKAPAVASPLVSEGIGASESFYPRPQVRPTREGETRRPFTGAPEPTIKQKSPTYPLAERGEWYTAKSVAGAGGRMISMTPDEFLARDKPLETTEDARTNIDALKRHVESGRRLDPVILYADGTTDGRHRAIAAKELGIKELPVLDLSALSPTQVEAKVEPKATPATAKEVIEGAGYQYVGEQQRPKGQPAYQLFNDETGSTLTLDGDNVTPESIRAKVEASRKQRGLDPLPAKIRLKGNTNAASDQIASPVDSPAKVVEPSTVAQKTKSAGAGKPASPPTPWASAKIGDTVEHEGKPVGLAGRDLREVKAKQIAEKSGGQVIPDPQNAKRFAVVRAVLAQPSLIDEVSALVDDKGKLTRGGDVVTSLMKDRSDAEVQALKDWADKHKSPAIQRFVGGGAAAELRSREKEKKPDHDFSSTQVQITGNAAKLMRAAQAKIDPADVTEEAGGVEEDLHATLKYGLHSNSPKEVAKILEGEGAIHATFGKVDIFPASLDPKVQAKTGVDYDVVIVRIISPDLNRLNKAISDGVEVTDTHPDYQSHATLAYVRAGEGSKYVGMDVGLEGKELTFDHVRFSSKDRTTTDIPLEGVKPDATDKQLEAKGGERKHKGTPPRPAVREDSSEVRGGQGKQASSSDRAEPGQASLEAAPSEQSGEKVTVHVAAPLTTPERRGTIKNAYTEPRIKSQTERSTSQAIRRRNAEVWLEVLIKKGYSKEERDAAEKLSRQSLDSRDWQEERRDTKALLEDDNYGGATIRTQSSDGEEVGPSITTKRGRASQGRGYAEQRSEQPRTEIAQPARQGALPSQEQSVLPREGNAEAGPVVKAIRELREVWNKGLSAQGARTLLEMLRNPPIGISPHITLSVVTEAAHHRLALEKEADRVQRPTTKRVTEGSAGETREEAPAEAATKEKEADQKAQMGKAHGQPSTVPGVGGRDLADAFDDLLEQPTKQPAGKPTVVTPSRGVADQISPAPPTSISEKTLSLADWSDQVKTVSSKTSVADLQSLVEQGQRIRETIKTNAVLNNTLGLLEKMLKKKGGKVKSAVEPDAKLIQQGFRDWSTNRAFMRNGRYILKDVVDGEIRNSGKHTAPWSKEVLAAYPDNQDFHKAAVAFVDAEIQQKATSGTDKVDLFKEYGSDRVKSALKDQPDESKPKRRTATVRRATKVKSPIAEKLAEQLYVEMLRGLSDRELRAEDRKIADAINNWAAAPTGSNAAYSALSAKLSAIGDEQSARDSGVRMTQQQWFEHQFAKLPIAAKDRAETANDKDMVDRVRQQTDASHRQNIEGALKRGESVAENVLADYPGLLAPAVEPELSGIVADIASLYGVPAPTVAEQLIAEIPGGPEGVSSRRASEKEVAQGKRKFIGYAWSNEGGRLSVDASGDTAAEAQKAARDEWSRRIQARNQHKETEKGTALYAKGSPVQTSDGKEARFSADEVRITLHNRAAQEVLNGAVQKIDPGAFVKSAQLPTSHAKKVIGHLGVDGSPAALHLADAIAAKVNAGVNPVPIESPEVQRHEDFHTASRELSNNAPLAERLTPEGFADYTEDPAFDTAATKLRSVGYKDDLPTLADEVAAYLADGEYRKLGLKSADSERLLGKWFTGFADKNGYETLNNFKELSDEGNRARASVLAGRVDASRESAESSALRRGDSETQGQARTVSQTDTPERVLADIEPRVDAKDFRRWLDDLFENNETEIKEALADDDTRRDYLGDYLDSEHQLRVRDDGLIEFWKVTPEVEHIVGDNPVIVYHHTSDALLPKIGEQGLTRGNAPAQHAYNSNAGVYVTTATSGPDVDGYLRNATQKHGGREITLGIRTTLRDLTPDPDDADISSGQYQFILPSVSPTEIVEGISHGVSRPLFARNWEDLLGTGPPPGGWKLSDKVPRLKPDTWVHTTDGVPGQIVKGKSSDEGPVYTLSGSPKVDGRDWKQDELTKFDEARYAQGKALFQSAMKLVPGGTPLEQMNGLVGQLRSKFALPDATIKTMKPDVLRFMAELVDEPAKQAETKPSELPERPSSQTGQPEPRPVGTESPETLEAVSPESVPGPAGERGTETGVTTGPGPRDDQVRGDDQSGDASARSGGTGDEGVPVPRTGKGSRGKRKGVSRPVDQAVRDADSAAASDQTPAEIVAGAEQRAEENTEGSPSSHPMNLAGDFFVDDVDSFSAGTLKQKYQRNIDALVTLRRIQAEGRDRATPEEQATLSRWIGWGQFPALMNDSNDAGREWGEERQALRALLSEEEWRSAQGSILNAHYTVPQIVKVMWDIARQMGFDRGRVLEPSMGSGNFFALMPRDMRKFSPIAGIELDKVTGAIAQLLYPNADIQIKGFEDYNVSDNFFDLITSNFPFGDYKVADNRYPPQLRQQIHDYFFVRSLDKVRPGGLIMGITSTGTMDKTDDTVRKHLAASADLVAAMRLPGNTFLKEAGTSVVTDIIILRKRIPGEELTPELEKIRAHKWMKVADVPDPDGGDPIPVNEYFAKHPWAILGRLDRSGTMYRGNQKNVVRQADFEDALETAISAVPQKIYARPKRVAFEPEKIAAPDEVKQGAYVFENGKLYQKTGAHMTQQTFKGETLARIKGMIELRDVLNRLTYAEMEHPETAEVARAGLNQAYDAFVKKYGQLNSIQNTKAFAQDPDRYKLFALERDMDEEGNYVKSDIFTRATRSKPVRPTSADSVSDAIGISLNEFGTVDLDRIAELMSSTPLEIGKRLAEQGVAFNDPRGGWTPADLYLSGKVREKLLEAREAARVDPQFAPNVKVLEDAQPEDQPYSKIKARIGAAWIPVSDVKQFMANMMDANPSDFSVLHDQITGRWAVSYLNHRLEGSVKDKEELGTPHRNFPKIIEASIDDTPIRVTYRDSDGKTVFMRKASAEANKRVKDIRKKFDKWIWQDDERRERLHRAFNDQFNDTIPIKADGSHQTFPGMNPAITLRSNQKDAVWRGVSTGRLGAAHEVGSGKTFTQIAIAMESRRLGLSNKPMIGCLNSNVAQFTDAAHILYPNAKILAAHEGMDPDSRQKTMTHIATGDWDMVILTHDNLGMIPMSRETQQAFLDNELAELRAAVSAAKAADTSGKKAGNRIVKQLEKTLKNKEAELKTLLSKPKDNAITFEEMGVDLLLIDEAHKFKSLPITTTRSQIKGIPTSKSDRARNMLMRTDWLLKKNNNRGVVFATGTFVSNTMAELYVMQRFLQPEDLRARGIEKFDDWANIFGDTTTKVEYTATGEYKPVTRFNNFTNLNQLAQLASQVFDVAFAKDVVGIKRPRRVDNTITVPMSQDQKTYLREIQRRAEYLKDHPELIGMPGEDNWLVIESDAKKSGIDMRLIDSEYSDDPDSLLNAMVRDVLKIAEDNPGKAQLIFSDVGVHETTNGISLYEDIIGKLVKGGIPRGKIIDFSKFKPGDKKSQEAKTSAMDRLNAGDAVIGIGGTEKMGTGVNVQQRLIAAHHIDAPPRPSDIEQRNGRIWRDGNLHAEEGVPITINVYTTEKSFAEKSWQVLDGKNRFIAAFLRSMMTGEKISDSFEDEDDDFNYAKVQAITSGNPLLIRRMDLEQQAAQLESDFEVYQDGQFRLRDRLSRAKRNKEWAERDLKHFTADQARYADYEGDDWVVDVEGSKYHRDREEEKVENARNAEYRVRREAAKEERDNLKQQLAQLKTTAKENGLVGKQVREYIDEKAPGAVDRLKAIDDEAEEFKPQKTKIGHATNALRSAIKEAIEHIDDNWRAAEALKEQGHSPSFGTYKGFDIVIGGKKEGYGENKKNTLGPYLLGPSGNMYQFSYASAQPGAIFDHMDEQLDGLQWAIPRAANRIKEADVEIKDTEPLLQEAFPDMPQLEAIRREIDQITRELVSSGSKLPLPEEYSPLEDRYTSSGTLKADESPTSALEEGKEWDTGTVNDEAVFSNGRLVLIGVPPADDPSSAGSPYYNTILERSLGPGSLDGERIAPFAIEDLTERVSFTNGTQVELGYMDAILANYPLARFYIADYQHNNAITIADGRRVVGVLINRKPRILDKELETAARMAKERAVERDRAEDRARMKSYEDRLGMLPLGASYLPSTRTAYFDQQIAPLYARELPDYSDEPRTLGGMFYSQLFRAIASKMPNKASVEQIRALIANPQSGVKPDEVKWTGLDDWLGEQKGSVSKDDVLAYLKANNVDVKEVQRARGGVLSGEAEQLAEDLYARGYLVHWVPEGAGSTSEIDSIEGPVFKTSLNDYTKERTKGEYSDYQDLIRAVPNVAERVMQEYELKTGNSTRTYYANTEFTGLPEPERSMALELADKGSRAMTEEPKFGEYVVQGEAENYREILLTLPVSGAAETPKVAHHPTLPGQYALQFEDGSFVTNPTGEGQANPGAVRTWNSSKDAMQYGARARARNAPFIAGHFDEPNILVHARVDDRETADGKKALLVNEVQSDWHQKGRKQGYWMTLTKLPEGFHVKRDVRAALVSRGLAALGDADGASVDDILDALEREQQSAKYVVVYPSTLAESNVHVQDVSGFAATGTTREEAIEKAIAGLNQRRSLVPRPAYHIDHALPDAPFKKNWPELAMRNLLLKAVEGGYDSLAWLTGEQAADLYDLSKRVDAIHWQPNERILTVEMPNGERKQIAKEIPEDKLVDYIGKDAAAKIVQPEARDKRNSGFMEVHTLRGEDLKVGGHGMVGFYDGIIPAYMRKLGKKWGAEVGEAQINPIDRQAAGFATREDAEDWIENNRSRGGDYSVKEEKRSGTWSVRDQSIGGGVAKIGRTFDTVHAIPITAVMKASIKEGQALFARDLSEEAEFEEIRKGGEELGRQVEGDFPVGIKNADTEKDRANLGLDPIIIEARKVIPTIDQALRDFNPERAYELVMAIGEHSRNLSGEETAQMTIYKVHLKHEYRAALNALRQAQDDADGSEQVARIRLAILDQQLQDYHEMGRRTAYEWHFTGLMRQQMMKADYSIEEVKMRARALYGDVLPEDLQQQLEDLVKERDNAIEALRVYDEQKSLEAAEQRLKVLQEQERREERNRKARQSQKWRENQEKEKVRVKVVTKIVSREALDDEFDQMSRDLDAMLTSDMGLNPFLEPRLLSQLKKMATNRVKAGADTVEDWILPVWERIKGKRLVLDAGATERDLRDALSGYGKTIQMSKEEIDIKLRELRALARDVSALEDIQGGQRPARSGLQRGKQTQRQRESKKRINATLREYNIQVETSERSPEDLQQSALDSMKTRLRNRIEDLKTYIEGGERAPKRPPVQPDPEAKILIAERDRLQKVLDDIEGPSKKTDDEKIALATAAVERLIADYEKRIAEGDTESRGRTVEPWSVELGSMKQRQAGLRDQLAEMRKAKRPQPDPEQRRLESAIKTTAKSIEDLERKIAEGDVLVHRKASEPWSRELGRLKKRQTELKAQVAEDRKNHLTTKAEAAERILRGLKSSIDRIERRVAAGDLSVTPKAPPSVSTPEIEAAKAQRKALQSILAKMRRDAKPEKTDAEKYASRLVALHKRLDKREAELNEMLRTGMFTKRPKPMPIRDPGIDAKRAAVKRAEDQIEMKLKEIDRENRGNWQKFVGHVAGVRRAVVLSSTFVIGKLTNAAMARIILSIGEEVAGAPLPYLPIIGVVARQAPSEGRLNLKAEYKHITKAFSREMIQQAAKVLKTGKMDIDILHGKKKEGGHPDSWYEFIGHVHGMLKTPAKIAAFERYMEKNLAWLHLHGYDVTSEPIKAIAAARAVIDANRAILQQDNVVSELFKKIMSVLEAKKYPTSEDPKKRQMQKFPTAAAILRFMFPVTRVPPNFLFESINYTPIGFAIAAARLGKAIYTHGLDEASYAPGGGGGDGEPPRNLPPSGNPFDRGIPPDDADAIIRGIKKATLGSPFMVLALLSALGLINFVQFGGYYRRGKKKKPEDVPFGGVRILGFNLPSWAGHIPLFEAMQMITTAVQVFQDYRDKDKEVQESATHAALDTARGMASEIPFYEEPSRALTATEQPEGAAQYAGDVVRGFIMPPDIQRAARVWDPGEPTTAWQKTGEMTGFRRGQPVKRKPEGSFIHRVGQEIELGVPGLRKNVPANTEVNRTDMKEGFTNQVRQLKVMVGETRYQKLTLGAPGVDDPDERERQRIQTWNNLSETQRNAWTKTMMQMEAAKERGQLKPDDPGDIAKDAQETPLQQQFSGKDIKEALIAYSHMSPEKRAEVKDLLIEKGPSIEKAYVTDQPELRRRFKELIGEDPGIKKRNQPGPTSKQWLNILKDPGQPSSSPPQ